MDELQNQLQQGTKDNLKVQALTQRIAELVAQYENQMADYRADATLQVHELQQRIQELNEQVESLRNGEADVVPKEDAPAEEA